MWQDIKAVPRMHNGDETRDSKHRMARRVAADRRLSPGVQKGVQADMRFEGDLNNKRLLIGRWRMDWR